jgi:vancomycin resistance protein VanJ
MLDRLLARLGKILSDDTARGDALRRLGRWIRTSLAILTLGYAMLLVFGAIAFEHIGERNLSFAFALYLPRHVFLLPGLLLLPVALIAHWRVGLVLLGAMIFFPWQAMGWKARPAPEPAASAPKASITVLTYNRGEHMNLSLQPFKDRVKPDIIALQEAAKRSAGYAKDPAYGEFGHFHDIGQFTILSRYPILDSSLIEMPERGKTATPVARFEIDFNGRRLALYSVHFTSPRDTLFYYGRGAALYGILGVPGTNWGEKRKTAQVFWDERIAQARQLIAAVEADPLPAIVVGDFNAPAGGYIHSLVSDRLSDAHLQAGHGFGFSFPGTSRNPLVFDSPWMRIDYLFCDPDWDVAWCITEPDRKSQHRAVAARFRLRDQSPPGP